MNTTMKLFPAALVLAAAMTACNKSGTNMSSNIPKDAVRQSDGTYRYADGSIHNADGSLVTTAPRREAREDRREWSDKPPTPDNKPNKPDSTQQSNKQPDLDTTQAIRKAVLAREGMSLQAQNVTIVTDSGTITLKGEVASEEEKSAIADIASSNAGGRTVDNQLTVATPKAPK